MPLGLPKCLLLTKALAFLTNPKSNKSLDGQMAGGTARKGHLHASSNLSLWPQELELDLLVSFLSSPLLLRLLLLPGPALIVLPSTNTVRPLRQIMWQTPSAKRIEIAKASTERHTAGGKLWRMEKGRKLNLQWEQGWPETNGLETIRTEWDTLRRDWEKHSRQG